jgi:hypothetical protein
MDHRPTSCPRTRGMPTEVIRLPKESRAIGGRAWLGEGLRRRRGDGLLVGVARRGVGVKGLATLLKVENRGL